MRYFSFNILAILLAGSLLAMGSPFATNDLTVDRSQSSIWIEGTSNLHDWECNAEQFSVNLNGDDALQSLSGGTVTVLAGQLDCDSNRMDRNTRDALKADNHPRITYQFDSAEVNEAGANGYDITLNGQLSLAGSEKAVQVKAKGTDIGNGQIRIEGSTPLAMTDFGIDPPRAMLGTLRTADDVTVHFNLIVNTGS